MAKTESKTPTPWAIICPTHGRVYLTKAEYFYQLRRAGEQWQCPRSYCFRISKWDDDNYERHMDAVSRSYEDTDDEA